MESSASYRNLRVTLLAGGVGGARLARALADYLAPGGLTAVVNVADDDFVYGALVSADLDTVAYTLAGINGEQGWGIADDTHVVMEHLAAAGVDTTFRLGDQDLAHCLARTSFLHDGGTLSDFTRDACARLGIATRVMPASDDPIRTRITTETGEVLDFQEYFVLRGHRDRVAAVDYDGIDEARPAPGVVDAIAAADIVVIAPSNPPLSIWPILGVEGIGQAVRGHRRVVAVSPLIGGVAVKGPLVEVMKGLQLETSSRGISDAYAGYIDRLVIDRADAADRRSLQGVDVTVTDTLITDRAAGGQLAETLLAAMMEPPAQ